MLLSLLNCFFMFSHITWENSFPKPLTPEEEQYYISQFEGGSEEARNILIERNLRLVAHIAKKYPNHIKDSEDFISIGTIGLIKAISTYKTDKGTRLATYAARCIENAIVTLVTHRWNRVFLRCLSKRFFMEIFKSKEFKNLMPISV